MTVEDIIEVLPELSKEDRTRIEDMIKILNSYEDEENDERPTKDAQDFYKTLHEEFGRMKIKITRPADFFGAYKKNAKLIKELNYQVENINQFLTENSRKNKLERRERIRFYTVISLAVVNYFSRNEAFPQINHLINTIKYYDSILDKSFPGYAVSGNLDVLLAGIKNRE